MSGTIIYIYIYIYLYSPQRQNQANIFFNLFICKKQAASETKVHRAGHPVHRAGRKYKQKRQTDTHYHYMQKSTGNKKELKNN